MIITRKVSTARLKALAHVVRAYGFADDPTRNRIASLRLDQAELLARFDPRLLALVPLRYQSSRRALTSDKR